MIDFNNMVEINFEDLEENLKSEIPRPRKWYLIEGSVNGRAGSRKEEHMDGLLDKWVDKWLTTEDKEELVKELNWININNYKPYSWRGVNAEIQKYYVTTTKTKRIKGKPTRVTMIEKRR